MDALEPTALVKGIQAVQDKVKDLTASANQAREESGEQVRARIAAITADMAAQGQKIRDEAAQAGDRTRSQWRQFRADAAARMRGIHDGVERKRDELDVKLSVTDARLLSMTLSLPWASLRGRSTTRRSLSLTWWMPGPGQTAGPPPPRRAEAATATIRRTADASLAGCQL